MGVKPQTALKTDVYDRIYKLVDEVLGEAIYYNGEMIQCSFFASSCGYTNSAENVWGVDYPYLRSVDCPLDKTTDPNWGSTDSYSSDYIKNAVQNTLGIALTGDPSKWFKINSRLDNREHGWVNVNFCRRYDKGKRQYNRRQNDTRKGTRLFAEKCGF